jgi:hypothetical protein
VTSRNIERGKPTLDQRFAICTNAVLIYDQQVLRSAKSELDFLVRDRLHDLDGHAVPCKTLTCDCTGRKDSNRPIGRGAGLKIRELVRHIVAQLAFGQARVLVHRA